LNPVIGIIGTGVYLPKTTMTAEAIAAQTNGRWTAENITLKLGINQIYVPGKEDGTQAMAVKASLKALEDANIDAKDIDLILSIGEEWKEYPLTTTSLVIQGNIGAVNAWGIDLQNRCSTGLSALKIAKDMMLADDMINTVLIAGGYRNGDLVDFADPDMSMMYNLSAAGGAILLQKHAKKNALLASHIISDGSLSRSVGVKYGGHAEPINASNYQAAQKSLQLFEAEKMKQRLNEVSMDNWLTCIQEALKKSGTPGGAIDYLNILHIKRSGHLGMLKTLNLTEEQSVYLENYGHMGQLDQIISIQEGLKTGRLKDGDLMVMIAAGVGYVWGASVVKWGPVNE
jgi:3-oxoacyl-[acyl-carrier-protein] synthase-3